MKKIFLYLLVIMVSVSASAQVKISDMPTYAGICDTCFVPALRNGINIKIRGNNLVKRLDSVTKSGDNVYYWINGVSTLAFNIAAGTGITTLNTLTATTQTFATGTSGTDFNISSATSTHTFNLPVVSGTNTGKVTPTLFNTWNGKQNAITLTTTGSSGAATLIGSTLNVPNYSSAGQVTTFSSGNLSPLFTTSVANPTSTPALTFSLSNAAAFTVYGRKTGIGAPSFISLDSSMIPGFHTEAYYDNRYSGSLNLVFHSPLIKTGNDVYADYDFATWNAYKVQGHEVQAIQPLDGQTLMYDTLSGLLKWRFADSLVAASMIDSLRLIGDVVSAFKGGTWTDQFTLPAAVNIYNSDGILTDPVRILTGDNDANALAFDSLNYYRVARNGVTRIYMNSAATQLTSPDGNSQLSVYNSGDYRMTGIASGNGTKAVRWDDVTGRLYVTDTSAGGGSGVNIYNSDGTLTDADRRVDGANDTRGLWLDSVSYFLVSQGGKDRIYMNSLITRLNSPNETNTIGVENDSSWALKKISYTSNLHGTFTDYSLIDKSYLDSVGATLGSTPNLDAVLTVGNVSDQYIELNNGSALTQMFAYGGVTVQNTGTGSGITFTRTDLTNTPTVNLNIQSNSGTLEVSNTANELTKYQVDRIVNSSNNILKIPIGTGLDTLATLADVRAGGGGGGGTGSNLSYNSGTHAVDIDGGGTSAVIPLSLADGATEGLASFTASDFDATAGNISIDYVNGQLFGTSVNGFTPASGGGTTNFLRADGTWATPPSVTNIYNTNGTLTADRVVTLNDHTLNFLNSGESKLHIDPVGDTYSFGDGDGSEEAAVISINTSTFNINRQGISVMKHTYSNDSWVIGDVDDNVDGVNLKLNGSGVATLGTNTYGDSTHISIDDNNHWLKFNTRQKERVRLNTNGILVPDGIMPTAGSGGTDSAVFRNSSNGQFYIAPASTGGSYTDEQAQDAVGAMVNASLQYVDGTPLLAIGDRDYGDITFSGSGLTATVDADITKVWSGVHTFAGGFAKTSYQTITSGASSTVSNATTKVIFNPASDLTAYTLTLPASPADGDEIEIIAGGTIAAGSAVSTSFTLSPNSGQSILTAITPTQLYGGDVILITYKQSNTTWYRKK